MSSVYNYALDMALREHGAHLSPGATVRTRCPICGGGSSKERSFTITHYPSGGAVYGRCWRASCGAQYAVYGIFPDSAILTGDFRAACVDGAADGGQEPEPIVRHALTQEDIDTFSAAFRLRPETLTAASVQRASRGAAAYQYCLPVEGMDGLLRGETLRYGWSAAKFPLAAGAPSGAPKAVILRRQGYSGVLLAWYGMQHFQTAPVVVTEDQICAMRAAQAGFTAVALLGCNFSADAASEIQLVSQRKPVILALDPDATSIALEIARDYAAAMNLRVALLMRELKSEPSDEALRTVLRSCYGE